MLSKPLPPLKMVSWFFATLLLLLSLPPLHCSASEKPNTDGFYVNDFFQKMGAKLPSSLGGSSSPVCSWAGVSCNGETGDVVGLAAPGLGLSGPIPDNTIGKLGKLRSLDLSRNAITALSSDLWGLGSSLRVLNLSSNRIIGQLPNNLGNLGRMESLDLSSNGFTGSIPAAIGSLSSLKNLDLSRNGFDGRIPDEIVGCTSLVSVDLSSNKLNGSVPDGLAAAFKNLSSVDFSRNAIRGKLPNLSGLESITYLNLSSNLLQGSVVGAFVEHLQVLDLSSNQFQGHLSMVILNSSFDWSSLVYLDISGNRLSGEFSDDWSEARSLKHLNLAFNRFSHQNFPKIGMLSSLEYINMSHNGLTGQIPAEISSLPHLAMVDLSQNHLTGSVPDLIGENLRILDLSVNNLTGEIPLHLQQKLPSMEHFNFSYNNLTLCPDDIPPKTFLTAFIGSQNDCPIAANPDLVRSARTKHRALKLTIAIALSMFFLIVGLALLGFGCRKRTRSWAVKQLSSYREEQYISGPFSFQTDSTTWVADVKLATSVPVVIFEKPLLNFTFADLLAATSHFDRGTLVAEGRFGPVYRGFLPGGIHVAVKVLVHESAITDQESARELERLGHIKHPNLVPLTGYCIAGDQRIAIYDYMENGNLHHMLHDLPLGVQTTEDWSNDTWEEDNNGVQSITTEGMTTWIFRHKIALGAARALAFLHHGCFPQIVHRDVKASSIYLDSEFEPRLSDFGLSSIVGNSLEDDTSRGLLGYAPPELCGSGSAAATAKSDVYGFGVILFELVTGKKPLDDEYPEEKGTTLVGWARGLVRRNQASVAIDPKIRGSGLEKQMEEALRIAYLCTADLPSKRPSMQQIVGLLKDIEPAAAADH